jgi:hypothetical protein
MDSDVKMVLGGVGALIAVYLVIANASNFSAITNSIAQDSASVISTLQGRGGTGGISLQNAAVTIPNA